MLKFRFFNSFTLVELWLCIHLIIILVACINTTFYYFPILVLLCPSIRFTCGMLCALILTAFAPQRSKKQIILGALRRFLEGYIQINVVNSVLEWKDGIIVANYPASFLEYLFLPMVLDSFGQKFCLVVGHGAAFWASKFLPAENLLILDKNKNYESLKGKIKDKLAKGYTPIVYPEIDAWKRKTINQIMPFRSGIFKIAQEVGIDIIVAQVPRIAHVLGFVTSNPLKIVLSKPETSNKDVVRECFLESFIEKD